MYNSVEELCSVLVGLVGDCPCFGCMVYKGPVDGEGTVCFSVTGGFQNSCLLYFRPNVRGCTQQEDLEHNARSRSTRICCLVASLDALLAEREGMREE